MKANHIVGLLLLTLIAACSTAFIGDILISDDDQVGSISDVSHGVRLANPSRLWPGGRVYYK